VGRDVTQVNPGANPTRIIRDGDAFTLVDITNFVTRFEFDLGPEVLVRYNPAAGIVVTDGMQFNLDGIVYEFDLGPGAPSVAPGAVAISLAPNATQSEFVDSIRAAMPATVTVGFLGGRLNFSGAINGSFTQLVQAGVFVDFGSSGNVSSGSIPIRVLASDTAETVATRISRVINTSGIPGLSSTFNGSTVQLIGARIQSDGPLFSAGIAPGGIITGATIIGNRMYAVSDEGGLYFVDNPSIPRSGNVGTYVATSFELTGIQFTALVAGPANVSSGSLTQILFGLDAQGNIHAFDTAGRLQRVFANGATSVPTGLTNANGVAFSTLNRNLWHTTSRRGDDPGHGIEAARNNSNIAVAGGSSFYFGLEDDGRPNNLTYNFPGGASGAIESLPISLAGISAGELPTFYFNYFLATEGAASDLPTGNNADDYMRDSFRVYVSGEDGRWVLTATNNDPVLGNSNRTSFDDELDGPLTGNPEVQRLFDNTGQWRQARVPLDLFAGQENVKIRIEFATAGGFGYGLEGGKGPEIRTIPASRLVDGESLLINGRRFEIEMGASLILPSGQGIRNGDSVTIDGTRYVFSDGTPVTAPDVAVLFTTAMTSLQVSEALRQAILGNPPAVPVTSGLLYSNESNDWIGRAERSGITGDTIRVVGSGMIGDNPALLDPTLDVDLVRIDVNRGATIRAEVQAASLGSGLDSFLRVFDSRGVPLRRADGSLVQNDNRPGSSDSLLTFVAPEDGTYFIGVSSSGNSNYNAAVSGTASAGTSSGDYSLVIEVQRQLVPVVDGSRLQLNGAREVSVSPGSAVVLQGSLGSNGVPVYLTADMTADQVARQLQRALADFFAGGAIGVYPIRGGDTLSLTGLVEYDSFNFITGQPEPSLLTFDSGPFGASTTFIGDQFSAYNTGTRFDGSTNNANPGPLQSRANAFEGVFVDDFVIGLAGRGELVVGPTDGNTNFIVDPQLGVTNPRRDEVGDFNVLVGPYQFEIRGGEEYGIPLLPGFPQTILYDTTLPIGSRMSQGLAIQFNHSSSLVAGTTFVVSDGTRRVTFEMDDVNDGVAVQAGNVALPFSTAEVDPISGAVRADTAQIIAARFRDIVNSTLVQSQLNGLTANLLNNDLVGATSDTVVLIGQAAIEVPDSVGQTIVSQGRGGSNRERLQGQVVVSATRVSNSLGFGATVTTGDRVADTNASIAGTPRNTITLNDQRLTPGAVIMNSEFLFNQSGGINIEGDAGGAGLPSAAVPFLRLVNNTILGGTVEAPRNVTPSIHGNFVFEIGSFAFADRVVSYNPLHSGGPGPIDGLNDPSAALGQPNYTGSGEPQANEGVVSLGRGGRLTLQFTDNLLTGSNSAAPDLVVFEVGDSEEVLVDVSTDGVTWTNVGRASAASPAIDIDAFGFNSISRIPFVRLTDVLGQGSQSGSSVGADIDAVGALSSVVVDQSTPGGRGISVTNNATATLMNNVLVNNEVGIHVDSSSQSTVIGGSVFQLNVANVSGAATVGQFPMLLASNVPVFVSPGLGNLYPTQGSQLIDSSIDSLQDRAALVSVKQPLGYAASPILAPRFDINGILRVDDPSVETPAGLGDSVFKDRGAQERGDFAGPSVFLQFPADNDSQGLDRNPEPNVAELVGVTPEYFDIRLLDGLEPSDPSTGSGIDHATVTSAAVLVYRNNQPMAEGIDYRFGYDTTNGIIRLQPLAGIWRGESVYTIRLLNAKEVAVVARDASRYQDGDQFDVLDASGSLTKFEFDLGYLVTVPSTNGIDAQLTEGQTFVITDGTLSVTFEFDSDNSVASGNQPVPLNAEATSLQDAAQSIVMAIRETSLQLQTTLLDSGRFQILGSDSVELDVLESGLVVAGSPGVQGVFGLEIPLQSGVPDGVNDGQTFIIDQSGNPVTFELDTNGTVQPGNVPVRFLSGASSAEIGAALATAINGTGLGLSAAYVGNGIVRLGGDANIRLDLSNTVLTQAGLPGQPAAIPLQISADATASQIAEQIRQAIESAGLSGVTMTSFGNRLLLEGALGASGVGAGLIAAIRDRAGNSLKPNQVDGTTLLTVFLGEGLDYGDAPAPWLSLRDDNGPRHTVVPGLSLGPTVTADVDARLPDLDQDDGVVFSSLFTSFQASTQVTVTNTTGTQSYVSLWIDFDGDGFFSSSEQIADGFAANTGTTTFSLLSLPTLCVERPMHEPD
jgi:large repetitive protein